VLLVDDDQVFKALAAKRPDHSLDDCVRSKRTNGRGDGIDVDPSGPLAEVAPVDRVPITQQMPRSLAPERGFK
jgi:hypothetical protein